MNKLTIWMCLVLPATACLAQEPTVGPLETPAARDEGFEKVTPGELPAGWKGAETNGSGSPAQWAVADVSKAAGGKRVLSVKAENKGKTYNLVVAPGPTTPDVAVEAKVNAVSGDEDQGGGVMWRVQDASNYYVARWNPLENNLRSYKVVDSKRIMIASADVEVDAKTWHTVRVEMRGDHILVSFDGKVHLDSKDAAIAKAGSTGLWTKADASTDFDDVLVAPLK